MLHAVVSPSLSFPCSSLTGMMLHRSTSSPSSSLMLLHFTLGGKEGGTEEEEANKSKEGE